MPVNGLPSKSTGCRVRSNTMELRVNLYDNDGTKVGAIDLVSNYGLVDKALIDLLGNRTAIKSVTITYEDDHKNTYERVSN
jgi:hypothetical protein